MSDGRFVLAGFSRLTIRVAELLAERDGEVVVVADHDDPLALGLDPRARRVEATPDVSGGLIAAGAAGATCVLALADDDLDNLRVASCANAVAPGVPLVLRTFDPVLAEYLEVAKTVRRAFSVSALSAAAFVAAALGEEVVETLRLGDDEVPLCRVEVRPGSPLVGQSIASIGRDRRFAVIARRSPGTPWAFASDDGDRLASGDELVGGGHLVDTLRVVAVNHPPALPPGAPVARRRREKRAPKAGGRGLTLLPIIAIALAVVFAVSTIVFAVAHDVGLVEAMYQGFTTGWGNSGLEGESAGLQLFAVVAMVAVGALAGVLFSHLAAVATAERLDVRMGRRAARQSGHVIVAGLGTVGYRVERLVRQLGFPTVVLEREPDSRFFGAASAATAVLVGDASLRENLERAGVERALCIVAATDDDLANIRTCLQARQANPSIRTVARIFDDALVEHVGPALGLDAVVSASKVAASAFVGAATDERAMRHVFVDELEIAALRFGSGPVEPSWRGAGITVVASDPASGAVVLAGPPNALSAAVAAT